MLNFLPLTFIQFLGTNTPFGSSRCICLLREYGSWTICLSAWTIWQRLSQYLPIITVPPPHITQPLPNLGHWTNHRCSLLIYFWSSWGKIMLTSIALQMILFAQTTLCQYFVGYIAKGSKRCGKYLKRGR